MTRIRCGLLDLGKVLVDFDLRPFAERMRVLTGLEADQLRPAFTADGLAIQYESGRIGDTEFHAEVCRRLGREIPFAEFANAWTSIFLPRPLLPDDLLSCLAKTVDLWILSNTNPLHFSHIAGHYSFMRHFRGYVVSYQAGFLKPDRRIFELALDKAGAAAGETLFVDDAMSNVEAARILGIDAFQFAGAEHFRQEMRARNLI